MGGESFATNFTNYLEWKIKTTEPIEGGAYHLWGKKKTIVTQMPFF